MKNTKIIPLAYVTDGKKVIAVICYQWGDSGKGKIVYVLASEWADIVIRGTGGPNAGHTLIYNGKEFVCHLLPSGILNPKVANIIGRGVALDLHSLSGEMQKCIGLSFDNLFISHEANLLMPYHILEDLTSAKSKLIGTTGCGIGPFYSDYYSRLSISMNDLANEKIFIDKFDKFLDAKQDSFNRLNRRIIEDLMFGKKYGHKFANGAFYDKTKVFNRQAIIDYFLGELAPKFKSKIINLNTYVSEALVSDKKILLEGAQGTLLSIDYGTTFYQTSSDCSVEGLAKGCGLKVTDIDLVLGITKAPYMTRVGNGPFPTEFGGRDSEYYCHDSKNNAESERALNLTVSEAINFDDEMIQGVAVRIKGGEYGATTGRARRPGWLDLPALKHSIKINGPYLVLTKFDVMTGVQKIKLCIGYKYLGPDIFYGDRLIRDGDEITDFIRESEILYNCKPVYQEFPGWTEDISSIRSAADLPDEVKDILIFIENFTHGKIVILSVGPSNDETIFLNGDL
ncbi:MAG: adenylosuccinate synthetase [Candidatus Falkowbacteria bacterium]